MVRSARRWPSQRPPPPSLSPPFRLRRASSDDASLDLSSCAIIAGEDKEVNGKLLASARIGEKQWKETVSKMQNGLLEEDSKVNPKP